MSLACQYEYMKVQIGTVDFTPYLSNTEQTATMPAGAEVGRATLNFRDDGSMPAIPKWGTVVISSGTAAPGTPVWGGYATRQSSEPFSMSGGTVRMVTVDCQSYAIALSTTAPITETYGGGNNDSILKDWEIVNDLVATYLPAFFDGGSISSANPVQCDYIQFSDETARSALNKVVGRSAKEYGITAGADFYYRPTGSAGTLGHQLSDAPDNSNSFPMQAKPYSDRDAVEVRNAVRVVGGWTLSAVQDETFTTDGIAYSFVVNYLPQDIIRVRLANVVLSVGVYLVDPPADFDVLVHYDQRKFIFQLPPSAGKTLEIEYRYPIRVEEDVIDASSVAEVGGTIWGPTIQDSSISQATVAQLVGSAYLARSTASIDRGQLTTRWVGTAIPYLPGQIVRVSAQALDWSSNEMEIQSVTMRFAPRPGGTGVCLTYWDLDVGTPMTIGQIIGGVYRDAPEVRMKTHAPDIREAITAGDVPTLDHGTGLTGLGDDDHTQYLLATGARTGSSSQAQTFTNGIIGPTWKPASDSTTALQMQNAAGTAIVTVDATNKWLGINTDSPDSVLNIVRNVAGIEGVLVNGTMSGANLFSRAYADNTLFSSSSTGAYCSFDASPEMTGTLAYAHYYGFEARNVYSSSGKLDTYSGVTVLPTFNGPVGSSFGIQIADPVGTGPVDLQIGLYVHELDRATGNYAVYTNGSTPSFFGGNVQVGGNVLASGTVSGSNFLTSSSENSVRFGVGASPTVAYYSTAIGHNSGNKISTGNHNTLVGASTCFETTTGTENTAIGSYAGYDNTGSGNVFLGYKAGKGYNSSDKLYIANDESLPLIFGDFANGKVGIATTTPETRLGIGAGALTMEEMSAPTGVANKAMLYTKDNGSGKTQLCCKLGNDVEIVLAIQA